MSSHNPQSMQAYEAQYDGLDGINRHPPHSVVEVPLDYDFNGPDPRLTDKPTNPKDIVGCLKAPMSTVPATVLAEIGVGMLEGTVKYGRHNYRESGARASVYYDAAMRHLMSWWEGEDLDPDSGLNHISKALTTLVVLRDTMIQGKMEDDRAPRSANFYTELNSKAAAIIAKYADRTPTHYTIKDSKS